MESLTLYNLFLFYSFISYTAFTVALSFNRIAKLELLTDVIVAATPALPTINSENGNADGILFLYTSFSG